MSTSERVIEYGDPEAPTALQVVPTSQVPREIETFMPVMSVQQAVDRYLTIKDVVGKLLEQDRDYGIIPGVKKPCLYKPGAEKLCTLFGLSKEFVLLEQEQDWTGEHHGGEPFFYYRYKCVLKRGARVIADCEGSANSWEKKYRYREAERVCPACGKPAIIKGKEEYGGGWVCFKKKGGCGAKFAVGDGIIEGQQSGLVPNTEIADQINTIQKMAQKRSFVGSTLLAVNASDFFTQDLDDMPPGDNEHPPAPPAQKPTEPPPTKEQPAKKEEPAAPSCKPEEKPVSSIKDIGKSGIVENVSIQLIDPAGKGTKAGKPWERFRLFDSLHNTWWTFSSSVVEACRKAVSEQVAVNIHWKVDNKGYTTIESIELLNYPAHLSEEAAGTTPQIQNPSSDPAKSRQQRFDIFSAELKNAKGMPKLVRTWADLQDLRFEFDLDQWERLNAIYSRRKGELEVK